MNALYQYQREDKGEIMKKFIVIGILLAVSFIANADDPTYVLEAKAIEQNACWYPGVYVKTPKIEISINGEQCLADEDAVKTWVIAVGNKLHAWDESILPATRIVISSSGVIIIGE
jgi:hypothetical protein